MKHFFLKASNVFSIVIHGFHCINTIPVGKIKFFQLKEHLLLEQHFKFYSPCTLPCDTNKYFYNTEQPTSLLSKTRFIDTQIWKLRAALLRHAGKNIFHICFIREVEVFMVLYQKKFVFITNWYILFCQRVKTITYSSALAAGNLEASLSLLCGHSFYIIIFIFYSLTSLFVLGILSCVLYYKYS